MTKFMLSLIACATALAFPLAASAGGIPYPTKATPKAVDAGAFTAFAPNQLQTVTVALKLRDLAGAQAMFESISTAGSPNYRKFLTPDQFRAAYAPTAASVAQVIASLGKFGLTATQTGSTTLSVTGTPAQLQDAFSVQLHQFRVAAHGTVPGYTFHAPLSAATIPADIAPLVHGVIGLDTRPQLTPHIAHAATAVTKLKAQTPAQVSAQTNTPFGELTVTDFAKDYNVTPLYNAGITGKGATMAIVTLATFTPSDAFAYWSALGLKVDASRLKLIDVDGGAALPPSDASGSDETTLDVEQSGGVAPGAKILVYEAPNTSQGFLDAFVKAVESNNADTISTSWGEWEWFDTKEASGTVKLDGQKVSELRAFNEVFLQAALQGQSMFASAGDAGAYDVNDGADSNGNPILPPYYSLALSVDSPASDPYMTAAGGTTLKGKQVFTSPAVTVDIKQESVWSWQYLTPLCADLGFDPISCGIFPVGGGGGVSVEFSRPLYQYLVNGPQLSQPKQSFDDLTTTPPTTIFQLPANFAGRNVPDISFNADPDTGYLLYYTSDVSGFGIFAGNGGTSFVAPQLNGVTALLNQSTNTRLGLLSVPLYFAAATGGYGGKNPPLNAISAGSNWFYSGSNGYNPGAGLGTLNVANFASFLKSPYSIK